MRPETRRHPVCYRREDLGRFVDIRTGERRPTLAAFTALLGITAGHTLLETARDALFLAKLPASRLPWVYLGIAGVGLLAARLNRARAARASSAQGAGSVAWALFLSAGVTAAFWAGRASQASAYLYALYLWVGIFGSWVVVQFWMLLGDRFTVVQAKRLYGFIGAGSVLGAVVGATCARALAARLPAQHLLLAAVGLFVLTAVGPVLAMGRTEHVAPKGTAAPRKAATLADDLRVATRHPYVRRILLLVLIASIAVTIVDYVFKAEVARHVAPERLGAYFASVYVVLNAIALVVQLFAVSFVLRVFGVHRAIWFLPLLLLGGAAGVALGGGLLAALLLKGADGSLRHSLHRTSTELLYVPLPDALRSRVKPFIDLVGQRGGQAVASLGILGVIALLTLLAPGRESVVLATIVAILIAAYLAIASGLRTHYLDLFRETLRAGRTEDTLDLPDLDLAALETLFGALNSQKNTEVIGALELLAAQQRQRLIPALILYHPSPAVVLRALDLFAREGRTDFLPIVPRLLQHPEATIRAAALRARTIVQPDEPYLRDRADDDCLEVRATAVVGLLSRSWLSGEEAERSLDALVSSPSTAVRVALAKAIAAEPSPRFAPVLERLLESPEPEVQLETAWAMGRSRDERFIPKLLPLLAARLQGAGARDALVEIGPPALEALDRAAADPALPDEVRWSLPRAIGMFEPSAAAPVLVRHLTSDEDGMVRFRILRALVRLRSLDPGLTLDEAMLGRVADETVRRAVELLAQRIVLDRSAAADPARRTPVRELLSTLLRDKETHALGRAFKVFGLMHPGESFERIQRGLAKRDPKARASSRELIENLIAQPLRATMLALLEDLPDEERLARVGTVHRPAAVTEESVLTRLATRADEVGVLARTHASEISISIVAPIDPAARSSLEIDLAERRPLPRTADAR